MPEPHIKFAVLAIDIAVFTLRDGKLAVLLIKMQREPHLGKWALPGGLVHPEENIKDAAVRHLSEKSGIASAYLEQLYTFGNLGRDPAGRVVSVAYMALIHS